MHPRGILADDLTGACDCGVAFSSRGARVRVMLDPEHPDTPSDDGSWDVTVVNTESRHLAPRDAAARVIRWEQWLSACQVPLGYKKIDSTLRGNLAAELEPLAGGGLTLVVCPAFPRLGRTVAGGRLLVNGTPVHQTPAAHDPLNPVRESHIPAMLQGVGAQGSVPVIPASEDPATLACALEAGAGQGVLVADASEEAHLSALAEAMFPPRAVSLRQGKAMVGVGSAGLAAAMAHILVPEAGVVPKPPRRQSLSPSPGGPTQKPVLVVAGSRHPATVRQVAEAQNRPGVGAFICDPEDFDRNWSAPERKAYCQGVVTFMRSKVREGAGTLLLTIGGGAPGGEQDDSKREVMRLRSERLNSIVGEIALAVYLDLPLAGLVLTGGDTARAVLRACGVTALQLGEELGAGIPLGWSLDPATRGLPVVTKSGGFGEPDTLTVMAEALAQLGQD